MPDTDNIPKFHPPYVNYCLLAIILIVYLWELSLGYERFKLTEILGFVPANMVGSFFHAKSPLAQGFLPLLTSLFIHGNALHLLPNIFFLFIFGDKVEEVLGRGSYLLFYLACGMTANLIYLLFSPLSAVPLIGASGAIAGVMAAHLSLFPGARFSTLFIISWVLLQALYGTFALINSGAGRAGMAWWAHVAGFVVGLALIRLLAPDRVRLPLRSGRGSLPKD
jgi:hypothetical protein